MKVWKVVGGLVLTGLIVVAALVLPTPIVYLRSPERIETYLKSQTPLGSPQRIVLEWLASRGLHPEIHRAHAPPNSEYPLTHIGGPAFSHETLATYGLPRVSVEAFYLFDDQGKLVDVRVRKTVDGS